MRAEFLAFRKFPDPLDSLLPQTRTALVIPTERSERRDLSMTEGADIP